MEKIKFRNLADIELFENTPIEERLGVFNTYNLIKKGAAINPDATAISFFLSGDSYDQPMQVTYRDLMTNITRTANLFHDLGVGPQDVVSNLLPNLPHTHYVLWGGEAAGIVNPTHGSTAAIKIKAASEVSHDQIRAKVSDILARYIIIYRLEIS
ncbi:MAG: AMP-binding protein [Desulfobacterales bacterium]|nr:AMP-binding protein [Desulfobacterales bacterium]